LTVWHCIMSAELTKTHSFRLFFCDFAYWAYTLQTNLTEITDHIERVV